MQIRQDFKKLIPPLSEEEFNQLEKNILSDGIREPLVVWNDILVDGHNRYKIATKNGLEFKTVSKSFTDEFEAKVWIINNQLGRRNISDFIKIELKQIQKEIYLERGRAKMSEGGKTPQSGKQQGLSKTDKPLNEHNTQKEIAKELNISQGKLAQAEVVIKKAPEPLKEIVRSGDISINDAYVSTKAMEKLPEEKQVQIIEKFKEGKHSNLQSVIKEAEKEEKVNIFKESIQKQIKDIEKGNIEELKGLYEVISVDPPWPYGRQYDPENSRVANPYPEMSIEQIKNINLPTMQDSIIFLWTTHKFLPDAFDILKHWGFDYKATLVWNKEKIGMGSWFRMQCEFCLFGIKGKPYFHNTTERDIIIEGRREHSRKPEYFFEMVNKVTIGRKLEYFSRTKREGWEVYGNDTNKF